MRHKVNKLIKKGKFERIVTDKFNIKVTYRALAGKVDYIEINESDKESYLIVFNKNKLTCYSTR